MFPDVQSGTIGWECPKCGRCYSPIVPLCHHCPTMPLFPYADYVHPSCTCGQTSTTPCPIHSTFTIGTDTISASNT